MLAKTITWQQGVVVLHIHNDNIRVRGTLARGHLQESRCRCGGQSADDSAIEYCLVGGSSNR